MVAVLGGGGRVHRVVVVHQVRVPLVGFPTHEAVEAFEAPRSRPVPFGRGHAGLFQRRQVPLAHAVGVVAALVEHLGEQCGVGRDPAVAVGEAVGELLDGGHADGGGVATGQQRCPGRGAQRGGVELRQPHTPLGDPRHGGHLDQTAEAVPGRDAGVVPHQVEDVRRILRRGRRRVRAPVRLRIPNVQFDLALKLRLRRPRLPRHMPPAPSRNRPPERGWTLHAPGRNQLRFQGARGCGQRIPQCISSIRLRSPLRRLHPAHRVGPTISRWSNRGNNSSKNTRSSNRARLAPRQ